MSVQKILPVFFIDNVLQITIIEVQTQFDPIVRPAQLPQCTEMVRQGWLPT